MPKKTAETKSETTRKTTRKSTGAKTGQDAGAPKSVTINQPNWINEENLKDYAQDVINSVVKTFHKYGNVVTDRAVFVYQQDKEHVYPIALTAPAETGERVIKLATYGPYRGQIAYQFAHEYCHTFTQHWILDLGHKNMWFAEMLCELASLWCIRRMGIDWEAGEAPRKDWVSFGPELTKYVERHVNGVPVFGSPAEFAAWLKPLFFALRKHSALRDINTIIAFYLLPLFEREPGIWEATAYMNVGQQLESDFQTHLQQWHDATPKKLRHYVAKVAAEMGMPVK